MPIYDADLESQSGVPANAINLKRMIGAHHGVLLVTPGIQFRAAAAAEERDRLGVAGAGSARDARARCFATRAFALAAASDGKLGGARCLAALRLILSGCRAPVIPNQLTLSFADQAYDDTDRLKNPADIEALQAMVRQLIEFAQQMK